MMTAKEARDITNSTLSLTLKVKIAPIEVLISNNAKEGRSFAFYQIFDDDIIAHLQENGYSVVFDEWLNKHKISW